MLSKHGKKRMSSRCNNSARTVKKVIEEGFSLETFEGDLRNYLELKKDKNLKNTLIVYNQKIFIFSEKLILITVLNIPGRLINSLNKQINKVA